MPDEQEPLHAIPSPKKQSNFTMVGEDKPADNESDHYLKAILESNAREQSPEKSD